MAACGSALSACRHACAARLSSNVTKPTPVVAAGSRAVRRASTCAAISAAAARRAIRRASQMRGRRRSACGGFHS
eukprot:5087190-Prymnesium_polylepis.1